MGYEVRIVAFTLGVEQPATATAAISAISGRAAAGIAEVVVVVVVDVVGGRRVMLEEGEGLFLVKLPQVSQRPVADLEAEMKDLILMINS